MTTRHAKPEADQKPIDTTPIELIATRDDHTDYGICVHDTTVGFVTWSWDEFSEHGHWTGAAMDYATARVVDLTGEHGVALDYPSRETAVSAVVERFQELTGCRAVAR